MRVRAIGMGMCGCVDLGFPLPESFLLSYGKFSIQNVKNMKNQLLVIALLLLSSHPIYAQKAPYNVVFDMTSDDTITHKMAIRWIAETVDRNPNANVEMVFLGRV